MSEILTVCETIQSWKKDDVDFFLKLKLLAKESSERQRDHEKEILKILYKTWGMPKNTSQ